MLLNNFFSIENKNQEGEIVTYEVRLNKDHHIFEGHFPEQPIAPGVCLAQMVKELCEENEGKKLKMISARSMKFMAVLNPLENEKVNLSLKTTKKEAIYIVRASCQNADKTFFKIDATYTT